CRPPSLLARALDLRSTTMRIAADQHRPPCPQSDSKGFPGAGQGGVAGSPTQETSVLFNLVMCNCGQIVATVWPRVRRALPGFTAHPSRFCAAIAPAPHTTTSD